MLMQSTKPLDELENSREFVARHIGVSDADEAHLLSVLGQASRRALIDSIVPRSIAHPSLFNSLASFVQDTPNIVASCFVDASELDRFQSALALQDFNGMGLPDAVGKLIDPDKMRKSTTAAVDILRHTHGDAQLPSTNAFALVMEVIQSVGIIELTSEGGLVRHTRDQAPAEELEFALAIYTSMHEVASALLFVRTECRKTMVGCVAEHKLRPDIKYAINFADGQCSEALATVKAHKAMYDSAASLPVAWAMPLLSPP